MKVVVYTTPTCGYCRMAKDFLRGKGVDFIERDVSRDPDAANEMVGRSGQMGVPVIIIDDEEVVVGFDRERLEYLISRRAKVKRPVLGLRVANAGSVAERLGLLTFNGVYIAGVAAGSIGEKAGLKEGDVIIEVNSKVVHDVKGLEKIISELKPGQLFKVRFLRAGKEYQSSAVV